MNKPEELKLSEEGKFHYLERIKAFEFFIRPLVVGIIKENHNLRSDVEEFFNKETRENLLKKRVGVLMTESDLLDVRNELRRRVGLYDLVLDGVGCFLATDTVGWIITFASIDGVGMENFYTQYEKPKKSGKSMRQITAPCDSLKLIQRALLSGFFNKYYFSKEVQGGVPDRSIITNAKVHLNNDPTPVAMLNLDIKDAFPSTDKRVVRSSLVCYLRRFYDAGDGEIYYNGQSLSEEQVVDSLMSLTTLNGSIPQGAPTSTHLLNLAMVPVDKRIKRLVKEKYPGMAYTRFVDDLTFSWDRPFDYKRLKAEVAEILKDSYSGQYKINGKKTKYMCPKENGYEMTVNEILILDPEMRKLRIPRRKLTGDFDRILMGALVELENKGNELHSVSSAIGVILFLRMVYPKGLLDQVPPKLGKKLVRFKELVMQRARANADVLGKGYNYTRSKLSALEFYNYNEINSVFGSDERLDELYVRGLIFGNLYKSRNTGATYEFGEHEFKISQWVDYFKVKDVLVGKGKPDVVFTPEMLQSYYRVGEANCSILEIWDQRSKIEAASISDENGYWRFNDDTRLPIKVLMDYFFIVDTFRANEDQYTHNVLNHFREEIWLRVFDDQSSGGIVGLDKNRVIKLGDHLIKYRELEHIMNFKDPLNKGEIADYYGKYPVDKYGNPILC